MWGNSKWNGKKGKQRWWYRNTVSKSVHEFFHIRRAHVFVLCQDSSHACFSINRLIVQLINSGARRNGLDSSHPSNWHIVGAKNPLFPLPCFYLLERPMPYFFRIKTTVSRDYLSSLELSIFLGNAGYYDIIPYSFPFWTEMSRNTNKLFTTMPITNKLSE